MNLVKMLISILLLTLVFGDALSRRIKSKSRNSIRKNHHKSRHDKERKDKNVRDTQRRKKKMSRNAFRNSEFTKSFENEMIEEYEDDDYFYDAPIIKIRFKRYATFPGKMNLF